MKGKMVKNVKIFLGNIISPQPDKISILNGYLCVDNGKITSKGTRLDYEQFKRTIDLAKCEVITMSESQFLMPGLIDCHVHAPQFPNLGVGFDRPLLEWLVKYTFPLEKKYSDLKFAANVYDKVVRRLLRNGTTTACYFGSLHLAGTLRLVDSAREWGQRALVGKVSMNVRNECGYYNDTETELADTERFVEAVHDLKNELIQPVITPRFAVSCDGDLMRRLGELAEKHNCRIQTHMSENVGEVKAVLEMFPEAASYTHVYKQYGLLTDKCLLAHVIHLSPLEMRVVAAAGATVAHCPASNTRLLSGQCPLRQLMRHGINVGLGTDVSGGDSASILDAMRRCLDVSAYRQMAGEEEAAISLAEALYMATLGGAKALGLDDKIGDFAVGKQFDALMVNVYSEDGPIDKYDFSAHTDHKEYVTDLVQRFIHAGDDRNIECVFVNGVERKGVL